jgi:DNA anti-recombination protein RmuC
MKKWIILLLFFSISRPAWAIDTWGPIIWQTGKQTLEHTEQLAKAVEMINQLKKQVEDTKRLLDLAEKAAEGIDEVQSVSDFRNLVFESEQLLKRLDKYIDRTKDVSEEWKGVFGSLEGKVDSSQEIVQNLSVSDEINSMGYSIADSYQGDYDRNTKYAQSLIQNSKQVNEKGALKQVAESMGHLLQMQNHLIYLSSQQIKEQSVENANQNLERKNEVIQLQEENKRVHGFINIVDSNTFGL